MSDLDVLVLGDAHPTQVVDPTGADDSFDAGFLAGTSTQPTIVQALEAIERGSVP